MPFIDAYTGRSAMALIQSAECGPGDQASRDFARACDISYQVRYNVRGAIFNTGGDPWTSVVPFLA
jgi:hypothetical protein